MEKQYLGDGVYIERVDDFNIRLYTSNGIEDTNEVFLDPHVLSAFINYIKKIMPDYKF